MSGLQKFYYMNRPHFLYIKLATKIHVVFDTWVPLIFNMWLQVREKDRHRTKERKKRK